MSWKWIQTKEAKQAGIAIGTVTVVALCTWVAWRNFKKSTTPGGPSTGSLTKPRLGKRFLKDQAYWAAINNIKTAAADDIKNGRISKNVIIGINKAMIQLVQDEYLSNIIENRRLRRSYMNNLSGYAQEVAKGNQRNEELLKEGAKEVVRDVGIDEKLYEQQSNLACHEDPNVAYMSIFLLESLKAKIAKNNENLRKEALIAYFNVQVENFDKYNFQELGLPTDALLATKQNFMSDLASIQLKIEEEDLLNNKLLLSEPEVVEVSKKLDEKVYFETQKSNRFSY